MDLHKEAKRLCIELCEIESDGFHFNFMHKGKLAIGSIIQTHYYGITQGANGEVIGAPHKCANMFYSILLAYIAQIRDTMGYTSEEAINEIIKRLRKQKTRLEDVPSIMSFKVKDVFVDGGNA